MAKILLVEDDNNLREIYEARLQAEGYDIVSARDGEEALTVAMKERPDLIISDVMMPKISGFDMLDIIRSTEETKNVKVIMMTALSQAEDKARAEKLGADRYLVKSQVTLEDVAKVAREVLSGESAPASAPSEPASTPEAAAATPAPAPVVAEEPASVPIPAPAAPSEPASTVPVQPADDNPAMAAISQPAPVNDDENKSDSEQTAIANQIESFIDSKKTGETPAPVVEKPAEEPPSEPAPAPVAEEKPEDASEATTTGKKVIQPISDPTASKGVDLNALLQKEEERDEMAEIAKGLAEKQETASETPTSDTPSTLNISESGELDVVTPPAEAVETAPVTETTDTQPSKPASGPDPDTIAL